MKTVSSVCAALLLCAAPVFAQQSVQMVATLSGGEETPAPGLLTGASGRAVVSVDVANEELTVTLTLFNLPSPTTASHIHVGARGVAGPVLLDFPLPTGRTGDLTLSFRAGASSLRPNAGLGIVTMSDLIQAILTGNAYVNVHTAANGAGEIRGQLAISQ
jgi:hypothetical protein